MELMFLSIEEVEKITGFGYSKAGGIIRELNDELKKKGFITHQGRVSAEYFAQRHGLTMENIKDIINSSC